MPNIRSAAQLNGIPLAGLIGSGAAVNTYYSTLTSSKVSFTTKTTLVGTSVSVVVPGTSSTVIAIASYVMGSTGANTTSGNFNWNGSDQTAGCTLTTASGASAVVVPGQQTYVITGVAAGTYTALLEGTCTTSSSSNGFINPGSGTSNGTSLTILVIGNS